MKKLLQFLLPVALLISVLSFSSAQNQEIRRGAGSGSGGPAVALLQAETNVLINFPSGASRWLVATNDLNFTATNGVDGASVDIAIANATGRNITNTFDTNWVWFGSPAPSVLVSNKFARFTIQYWAGLTNYQCFYSPSF